MELLDTSRGVLRELDPPVAGEGVSTVVSQHENVVLDYMVYPRERERTGYEPW